MNRDEIMIFTLFKYYTKQTLDENDFINAIEYGYKKIVKHYISTYGINVVNTYYHGLTPLMYAALNDESVIAKLLIENGADVNLRSLIDGKTALMLLSETSSNYREVDLFVEPLLKADANMYINDIHGNNAITIAAGGDISTTFENIAYLNDELDRIRLLIKYKADVNSCDGNGRTPLMYAAGHLFSEVVNQLLKSGAWLTINNTDKYGMTALMYLCRGKCMLRGYNYYILNDWRTNKKATTALMDYFLSFKPDLNMVNNSAGDSALMVALKNRQYIIASKLIQHGARLDIKNTLGESAESIFYRIIKSNSFYSDIEKEAIQNIASQINLQKYYRIPFKEITDVENKSQMIFSASNTKNEINKPIAIRAKPFKYD